MVGSKKIGIKSVYAKYGAVKKIAKSGADFEINSVREVLEVVKKLNS
jgi:hypothetical protein